MLDPIDFINDHPEMTDRTRNMFLLICILSLVIMILYSIVKSTKDSNMKMEVNESLESLRKQWREEDIRLGNEIYDDDEEISAE